VKRENMKITMLG